MEKDRAHIVVDNIGNDLFYRLIGYLWGDLGNLMRCREGETWCDGNRSIWIDDWNLVAIR